MDETVILEWSYSPVDFIEECISITEQGYEMKIDQGKIEAKVKGDYFDSRPTIDELDSRLKSIFMGVQLINRRKFSLSEHTQVRILPDGKKFYTLSIQSAVMSMTSSTPDLVVRDKDGNVIGDTKRDRLDHQKQLAGLIGKYMTNPVIDKLLSSFSAALDHQDDEFTYLYEIRDSLLKAFGYKKIDLVAALVIDDNLMTLFEKITNDPNIKQSRHRGKRDYLGERDATPEELNKARGFAFSLIEKYLHYIDSHPSM